MKTHQPRNVQAIPPRRKGRATLVAIGVAGICALAAACGDKAQSGPNDAQAGIDGATHRDAGPLPDVAPLGDSAVAGDADVSPDGGGVTPADCAPLPAPSGNVLEVFPGEADSLRQTILDAPSGTTILLHDGDYALDGGDNQHRLSFYTDGVTLRSYSGDREAVTLDGGYVTGELVSISANDVTIADLTLTRAYYHPIHVTGGDTGDITGTLIYDVHIIDPGEQAIKINPSGNDTYADQGVVACSRIELTDAGRPHIRNNCYTGGVDAHHAWGWEVRQNHIEGFWCDTGLSEHGIHFWTGSRDTLVERNVITNCARGIGFGLGESGATRDYPDNPYPGIGYIGHYDGIIRNNFIFADIGDRFDSGISLDQAHGTQVIHNTVVSTTAPFDCIEWRFDNADVTLTNNLVSHNLLDRGGTATLSGNLENADPSSFVDSVNGDLHLAPGAAAIDAGVTVPAGLCDTDIDGESRDSAPDVGADEVAP